MVTEFKKPCLAAVRKVAVKDLAQRPHRPLPQREGWGSVFQVPGGSSGEGVKPTPSDLRHVPLVTGGGGEEEGEEEGGAKSQRVGCLPDALPVQGG